VCLSISIDLCFLEEQLCRYYAKSLKKKKRVRVDTMPNSLLREFNSFRRRYHSLVAGKHKVLSYELQHWHCES
jgi:hypothetical protein